MEDKRANTYVTTIYERRTSLRLLDEVAEEMRFVGEVQALNTSFGDDAAIVRLGTSERSEMP